MLGYRPEDLLLLRHSKSTIEDTFAPFQEALHLSARYNGFIDLLKSLVNSIPQDGYNRSVSSSFLFKLLYECYRITGLPNAWCGWYLKDK